MNKCTKIKTFKYSLRNAPPYPANKCKSMKKKGNDGKLYLSQSDKNGIYKWVNVYKKNTLKTTPTKEDLQMLVKKYEVTRSGSNKEVAKRLLQLRSHIIKNKKDMRIILHFL